MTLVLDKCFLFSLLAKDGILWPVAEANTKAAPWYHAILAGLSTRNVRNRLFTFSQLRLVRTITATDHGLHFVSHQSMYDARSTLWPLSIPKQGQTQSTFSQGSAHRKTLELFLPIPRLRGDETDRPDQVRNSLYLLSRGVALDLTCTFGAMFFKKILVIVRHFS